MVDSTDRVRLCVAKEELSEVLKHEEASSFLSSARAIPPTIRFFLQNQEHGTRSSWGPHEYICTGGENTILYLRNPPNQTQFDLDIEEFLCSQALVGA